MTNPFPTPDTRASGATRGTGEPAADADGLLFDGPEWDFPTVRRTFDAIEKVGTEDLGLSLYPTRLEVINAEQMLDAYASVGMPTMYRHWAFGKRFVQHETMYRRGFSGLALEIVINADPSLCYIMEENTMTMQATVMAHAAVGHNHFFKNNRLFQEWTDPEAILDYLSFAKSYIAACEEKYGIEAVERTIDAAHALQGQGVDRSTGRGRRMDARAEQERVSEMNRRNLEGEEDLWLRTVPVKRDLVAGDPEELERQAEARAMGLPEENLLYFLEKNAPRLREWQRELLRIVRNIATYFEPQKQTKMMNEGCACWCHYTIMTMLHERGLISDSAFMEFLHLHANVVTQPAYDDRRYSGINPYALGFAMTRDIERICTEPTEEDRAWFPGIAGNDKPVATLCEAWANYRDESFIRQYLSPRVMRDFAMFRLDDDTEDPDIVVEAIHDERGYRRVRQGLANLYDPANTEPRIEVVGADIHGDRTLTLQHTVRDGRLLDALETRRTLRHLSWLWGYHVRLTEVDAETGHIYAEHENL